MGLHNRKIGAAGIGLPVTNMIVERILAMFWKPLPE
jgi:hypothetical protein